MFIRFRLIVLLIVNLALSVACGPSSKPSAPEPSKPIEFPQVEYAVVNVHLRLAARSGPGLKYPRQKILKFGISVKVLEKKKDKLETMLGLKSDQVSKDPGSSISPAALKVNISLKNNAFHLFFNIVGAFLRLRC